MDWLCLLRNINCAEGINPFNTSANLIPWIEFVGIAAFLYTGIQFLSRNETTRYLFTHSVIPKIITGAFALIIGILVFATALPIIRFYNEIPFPYIRKIFLLPTFWELIALILLLALVIFLLTISLFPKIRWYFWRIKSFKANPNKYFESIRYLVVSGEQSNEFYGLVVKSLLDGNLKYILSQLKERGNKLTEQESLAYYLVNIVLSNNGFIRYLTEKDKMALLYILNEIRQSGSKNVSDFIQAISYNLFISQKSLLEFEIGNFGEGFEQPIIKEFYADAFFYKNFDLFFGVKYWRIGNIDLSFVRKARKVLESQMQDYFSDCNRQAKYSGHNSIHWGLEMMASMYENIILDIHKLDEETIYENKHRDIKGEIESFFQHSENCLHEYFNRKPCISDFEMKVEENSVTEALIESIFKTIEALSWIKEAQEYVRMSVLMAFDWIWDSYNIKGELKDNLQKKMFEKFDERIKENLKGQYPSMTRVLMSISGISNEGKGLSKLLNKYKSKILRAIKVKKNVVRFIPSDWIFDKKKNLYKHKHGAIQMKLD